MIYICINLILTKKTNRLLETNEIRYLNIDKAYKKNCLVADNYSVILLITYYCGACIAK